MVHDEAAAVTTRAELASYVRDFLSGGEGYLLDCFMQERAYDGEIEPFAMRLFDLHEHYANDSYRIGLSNPEAKPELWKLVQELESA